MGVPAAPENERFSGGEAGSSVGLAPVALLRPVWRRTRITQESTLLRALRAVRTENSAPSPLRAPNQVKKAHAAQSEDRQMVRARALFQFRKPI